MPEAITPTFDQPVQLFLCVCSGSLPSAARPPTEPNLTFYKLTNSNLYPLIDYHLTSRQTSVGVNWLPNGGERVSIFAEYTWGQSIPTYFM